MKTFFKDRPGKFLPYILWIILIGILFNKILEHFSLITTFLSKLISILSPFIFGFSIAFIFNPAVKFIERVIFKSNDKYSRKNRLISIIVAYVLFFGILSLLMSFLIPTVANSLLDLMNKLPQYVINFRDFVFVTLDKYGYSESQGARDTIDKYVNMFLDKYDITNIETYLESLKKGVISVTTSMYNIFFGFLIAFYFLLYKEVFQKSNKRVFKAILPERKYILLSNVLNDVNKMFSKFLIGKAIDSLIIAVLCFIGLFFLRIKYAIVLSAIIGVTNMIPYFGPIIGGIPAVLLTLLYNPIGALWVAIFVLILQQFDGWILGPKILGDNVGLSPLWIIFAIIIGGGFFGFLGMILGVPTIAVIKLWFDKYIDRKVLESKDTEKAETK